MYNNKENLIILLVIMLSRTSFLFTDAVFSSKSKNVENINKITNIAQTNIDEQNFHSSADESFYEKNDDKYMIEKQDSASHYQKIDKQNKEDWLDANNLNLKDIWNNLNNIDLLEKIYSKTKSKDVLKILVDKLLIDYQFEKAKSYIWNMDILKNSTVDAKSYFYTQINTLSITDPHSMNKFMSFVDQMKYKSLVSSDDYLFYQWLAKVWSKDYFWANDVFKQIQSPVYKNFVSQINDSIIKFNNQKWVPSYYKDSLIALVLMKNWYFSIANKLAVDSILQNRDYILPYQVLAYSNFLTNNREKAIENFYVLNSLDIENQDKYNFYIWVSQYWLGDSSKSILTLSQLTNNSKYKTDAYRYLLLNYTKLQDEEKMIQVWQRLLWQSSLKESDFKTFYDIIFYQPFSKNLKHNIYKKYKQISYDYVSTCYEIFGQTNDTCLYWEVWLDIANNTLEDVENNLLYLAEKYPQSHIFQALWDFYKNKNLNEKAKTYYLKAISLTENISQKNLIEQHLAETIN